MPWGVEQRFGRARFDDLALIQEHHPVGHLLGEAHLVGRHQHGHAFAGDLFHHLQDLAAQFRVERRGRLVEQHDLGVHGERAGDRDALALAPGQLLGEGIQLVAQTDLGHQLVAAARRLARRLALHRDQPLDNVFQRAHVRPKVIQLKDHADVRAHARDLAAAHAPGLVARLAVADPAAVDPHRALVRVLEEVDAAQDRALARAAGPDQADHLTASDSEVDPVPFIPLYLSFRCLTP